MCVAWCECEKNDNAFLAVKATGFWHCMCLCKFMCKQINQTYHVDVYYNVY